MVEFACKKCGKNEGFYRNVELVGDAWVDVDIQMCKDGSIEGTEDNYIQDKRIEIDYHRDWGCASCGHEAGAVQDLVGAIEPEDLDPIAMAQRNPIKGQEALPL